MRNHTLGTWRNMTHVSILRHSKRTFIKAIWARGTEIRGERISLPCVHTLKFLFIFSTESLHHRKTWQRTYLSKYQKSPRTSNRKGSRGGYQIGQDDRTAVACTNTAGWYSIGEKCRYLRDISSSMWSKLGRTCTLRTHTAKSGHLEIKLLAKTK